MQFQVVTFGNGEILKGIFDALAMCLNPETGTLYTPLIRIGMILSVFWAAIYGFWGDYIRVWGKAIVPFVVLPPLLFVPTTSIYIHDVVSHYREKVDNVPYGLAYISHFISTIGYEMTKQVDRVFAHVDDLQYHKSGFLMASKIIQQAKTFRITHQDLTENMRGFVTQCVTYDAMLGRKYTLEDLRHTNDIWGLVSANASPVRSFMWRDPRAPNEMGRIPEIITCQEGVKRFNQVWGSEIDRAKTIFGTKVFGSTNPLTAKTEFLKYLPVSYGFLTDLSKSADEIMKQQMMIYALVDGVEHKSVSLGNAPNFAARRAYLQQRATYETLGSMASETLVTMKAVLEAIAYAAFIFVVPLCVLPFGPRILLSWAQILLWLQMWAPLYAVLNFIMTTTARYKSLSMLSLSNPEGITLASSVGVMNLNADLSAMAGYLAMSIPFLAIALIKGVSSFVSMAAHLGGVSQGAASQAASEAVTGNYSFGNISEGSVQIANTHMLQHSNEASYRASAFHKMDGRTEMTTLGDGSQVVNVGSSTLPMNLNKEETQSAQQSEMATRTHQQGLSLSASSSEQLSRSYRDTVDLSHSLAKAESRGDAVNQGISAEQSQAVHKTAQLIEGFAKDNNISTQKSTDLLGETTFGLSSGSKGGGRGGFSAGGSLGAKGNLSANDQEMLQKAQKYAEDHNLQDATRKAEQASKTLSHTLTDDYSKRLAQDISTSYETARHQREEAAKSFSESDAYSRQAMNTRSNASSINANHNQQFIDWLAKQEAPNTHGGHYGHRAAAHMIAYEPQTAARYAGQFMKEQGLVPQENLYTNPQKIESDYHRQTGHQQYAVNDAAYRQESVEEQQARTGMHEGKFAEAYKSQSLRDIPLSEQPPSSQEAYQTDSSPPTDSRRSLNPTLQGEPAAPQKANVDVPTWGAQSPQTLPEDPTSYSTSEEQPVRSQTDEVHFIDVSPSVEYNPQREILGESSMYQTPDVKSNDLEASQPPYGGSMPYSKVVEKETSSSSGSSWSEESSIDQGYKAGDKEKAQLDSFVSDQPTSHSPKSSSALEVLQSSLSEKGQNLREEVDLSLDRNKESIETVGTSIKEQGEPIKQQVQKQQGQWVSKRVVKKALVEVRGRGDPDIKIEVADMKKLKGEPQQK